VILEVEARGRQVGKVARTSIELEDLLAASALKVMMMVFVIFKW